MKENTAPSQDKNKKKTITVTISKKEKRHNLYAPLKDELSRLSEEVKVLLSQKRYTAALDMLFDIASKSGVLYDEPTYLALQADALSWIGFVYRQMRHIDKAELYIDEAIEILQDLYKHHRRFSRQLAKAYINKAAGAMEEENVAFAYKLFNEALKIAKSYEKDPCLHIDILYEGAILFNDPEYLTKAKHIVHLCDEKKERIWIKKINHLEQRLKKKHRA